MAVKRAFHNRAYGHKNALQSLAPEPIVARRDPTSSDQSEISTLWVNTVTGSYFVLTGFTAGAANWQAQATGSGTFASVEVTGGAGDVLVVDAGGDTDLGGNLAVAGDSVLAGDLTVNGDLVANGDFDITSAEVISFTSTANAAPSILFETNGGTTETLEIYANQGTSLESINIHSDAGGIAIESASKADVKSINLISGTGGITFDGVLTSTWNVVGAGADIELTATGGSVAISSTEAVSTAINLTASDAAGGIAIAGAGGVAVSSTNATISVASGTGATNIGTDAAAKTITIGNSTGATSVVVNTGTGALNLGTNAVAHTVTIGNVTGATAVNINAGSGGSAITTTNSTLGLISGTGAINVGADAAAKTITVGNVTGATAVNINTGTGGSTYTTTNGAFALNTGTGSIDVGTDAAAKAITIGNVTGATSVAINSGTGSIALASTGTGDITLASADTVLIDSAGVLELNSSAGVIGIGNDAVAQNINIGTGAADRVVTIGNVTGASQVVLNSGTAGVAINTTGTGDVVVTSADTVLIDAAGVLELNSSAGVIGIGNDAVAQNINVGTGAAARTITIGNNTGATALALTSGTGSITLTSTGTGDILLDSDDTLLIDADGVLELNSSAGAISIGNDADAQAINVGTGAAARTITIGNTTGASSVIVDVGTGACNIGTSATAHATTVGSTTAASTLTLQTPVGSYVTAAHGVSITTAGRGLSLPGSVLILSGAGSPNGAVTAAQGSLYLRTDGSSTSTRAYINSDGVTAWVAVTTAS